MTDDAVVRFSRLATSTIGNALDELGYAGIVTGLHPLISGRAFCGRAVTVKQVTGEFGAHSVAEFKVGAMIDATAPGQVIIVDNGGASISSWGGLASLAAKIKGIAGTIIDGGARDVEEIRDCGYAVQARHIVPTGGRKRIKVEGIGVPIEVSGVGINPAEIVKADDTGIVRIPADYELEVLALAEEYEVNDKRALELLKTGQSFSEAMRKFNTI